MASKDNTPGPYITLEEAAAILQVEPRSATHVEGSLPDGTNLCLKQIKVYSRADAEAIAKARAEKASVKAAEKAAKEQEKAEQRQEVQRQEPANKTLAAVKELVES